MNKIFLLIVLFIAITLEALAKPVIQSRVKRQFHIYNDELYGDRITFVDSFEEFERDRRPSKIKATSISPIKKPFKKSTVNAAPTATTPSFTTTTQATTTSTEYRQCLDACLTTSEYNPVCGSDSQTYFNRQKLDCANQCGSNVIFVRSGKCRP